MSVTKHVTVLVTIDAQSYGEKSLTIICFNVPQKREHHTGLKQHEGKKFIRKVKTTPIPINKMIGYYFFIFIFFK